MQKAFRYVHENKFPELKDKNVTYLLKICSGWSKQSVEFLLQQQQQKGTSVMFTKIWNQTRVIKEKITEAATGENSQWDLDAKA